MLFVCGGYVYSILFGLLVILLLTPLSFLIIVSNPVMLPCESPVMICMKVDYQFFKVEFRDSGDFFSIFAVAVRVCVVKGFVGQSEGLP